MLEWLNQNAGAINALTGLGVLALWSVYATLFYNSYSRQQRARLVIDQMSGPGTSAACVITNLSAQPLYLECVIAVASTREARFHVTVTDYTRIDSNQSKREIVSLLKQGPLEPGEMVLVGTLEALARNALAAAAEGEDRLYELETLEIRVATIVSSQDMPMGALKRFDVNFVDGATAWKPARQGTEQLRSRRDQRTVRRWMRSVGSIKRSNETSAH